MGALNGYKVLDFSTLLPGPYATMTLADMGAEVLTFVFLSNFERSTARFIGSSLLALKTI